MSSPTMRLIILSVPARTSFKASTLGATICCRLNIRSWRVRLAALSAASWISPISTLVESVGFSSARSNSL